MSLYDKIAPYVSTNVGPVPAPVPVRPRPVAPAVLYIGAVGGHGLGKSTMMGELTLALGDRLQDRDETANIYRVSLGDPLRAQLGRSLPHDLTYEKKHPLERSVLQYTGEVFRAQDRNYWVKKYLAAESMIRSPHYPSYFLSDDVYHVNEAMLMDVLILIGNPQTLPEDEYVPVSIRETAKLLKYAPYLHSGTRVSLFPRTPEELSSQASIEAILTAIDEAVAQREELGGVF